MLAPYGDIRVGLDCGALAMRKTWAERGHA